jgi:hypothetical protein
MKHNLSITLDQKLFRELETIRGREKRSTFIEHLIALGLKNYQSDSVQAKNHGKPLILPPLKLEIKS